MVALKSDIYLVMSLQGDVCKRRQIETGVQYLGSLPVPSSRERCLAIADNQPETDPLKTLPTSRVQLRLLHESEPRDGGI
jgi:hypothetical protein